MATQKIQKNKNAKGKVQIKLADMTTAELLSLAGDLRGQINKTKLEKKNRNTREVFNLRKKLARALTMVKLKAV